MKNGKNFEIDVIHEFIKIDKNEQKLLKEEWFINEISRSKNIFHLGVIGEIFPLTKHSKWEHMLGVYYLTKKANEYGLLKGIEKKPAFFISSLIHALGHCPLTLTTEDAILVAKQLNKRVENRLKEIINAVLDYCPQCKDCDQKCFGNISIENRRLLYKWLTAYKITNLRDNFKNDLNINIIDIIKPLVCKNSQGFTLLNNLDRIDFVLRDIYYSGIGKLDLNVDLLFSSIKIGLLENEIYQEWPPEEEMLKDLEQYLEKRIYLCDEVTILSTYLSKIISLMLLESKVSINDLISFDDAKLWLKINNYISRHGLTSKNKLKEKIENLEIRKIIEMEVPTEEEINILELEKDIACIELENLPTYPIEKGIFVHLKLEDIHFAQNLVIRLFVDDTFKSASPSLHAISKIKKISLNYIFKFIPPHLIQMTINEAVLKLLFVSDVNVDYKKNSNSLEALLKTYLDETNVKEFTELILKSSLYAGIFEDGNNYNVPDSIQSIYDLAQDNDIKLIPILAEELVKVPQFFAKQSLTKIKDEIIIPSLEQDRENLDKSDIIELVAYFDLLSEDKDEILDVWVMPNVKLYESGDLKREFDGFSVKLFKDGKVEITIIECTKTDGEKKTINDIAKDYHSRNELSQRFDDINVGMKFYGEPLKVEFIQI